MLNHEEIRGPYALRIPVSTFAQSEQMRGASYAISLYFAAFLQVESPIDVGYYIEHRQKRLIAGIR
ncbi:hypothetical protein [Haladaptatus sp. DFWS20]|uniref:hypothetical protein n=1 Tax=Haladaptatus sp. DFWS20 TaxID=3403467 RepID=UPI003EBFB66A